MMNDTNEATGLIASRRLLIALWMIVLTMGTIQTWGYRHFIDADAISYMDIAEAVSRGQWAELVNGYWSPLYPALMGAVMWVVEPSPRWQATLVHLVHIPILIFVMAGFHYFWTGVMRYARRRIADHHAYDLLPLPDWAWLVIGYSLFAWAGFGLIEMSRAAPDLMLAGFLYLGMGVIVRIRLGSTGWKVFLLLGLVLGFGYLCKSVMFPLAFLYLLTAFLLLPDKRREWKKPVLSLAVFLMISSTFIIPLSLEKNRLTYGDVGKLAYAIYVTGYHPDYVCHDVEGDNPLFDWQGGLPLLGEPLHPKQVLLDEPRINAFAEPIGGSYPFWYDPSYWYDGMQAKFNLAGQIEAFKDSALMLYDLLIHRHGLVIAAGMVLLLFSGAVRHWLREWICCWWLLLLPVAGIGLFSMVLVLPRYVAPFFVMLWAAVLAALVIRHHRRMVYLLPGTALVIVIGVAMSLAPSLWPAMQRTARDLRWRMDTAPNIGWEVADGLHALGIQPGDQVAHIGKALKNWSWWASVADVTIVAELRPTDAFWQASPADRAEWVNLFREQTAARAIVARRDLTDQMQMEGWQRIGRTHYAVHLLSQPQPDSPPQPQPVQVTAAEPHSP